ncbi:respiratory nitrate reductase subunit alpha [Mycobacteroides abscessus subsp. abscessus]|nr:respiratory nitrate reductase subunit alpha [Mycobacteroides abscessus subsp. abscessus]
MPYTPAWQEGITGVKAETVSRIAREFAQNSEDTKGRSMILMGGGTNHWYHSDVIYRTMILLTTITGCQGRRRVPSRGGRTWPLRWTGSVHRAR